MIRMETKMQSKSKRSSKRSDRRFILLLLVLVIGFAAWLSLRTSSEMQNSMFLYLSLWLLIIVGFFTFASRWSFSAVLGRQFDILEIPVYLGLASIFLIQAFGLALYFNEDYLRVLPSVSYLPSGLLLTGVGLFSLWIGYALVSKSFKKNAFFRPKRFYNNPSLSLTLFAYFSILSVRFILMLLGSGEMFENEVVRIGGNWYQWFVYLYELRWFFIALVTLQVAKGRWRRQFLVIVLLIEGGMAVVSGWSSLLPKIGLLVFGCLIYARKKLPWRRLLPVAIIAVLVIAFSIPVTRNLRITRRAAEQITISTISNSIDETWGKGFANGWSLLTELLIKRQSLTAQTPSVLLYLVPDRIPYFSTQDLIVAPFTFIPRIIWPSKPVYTDIGGWLTKDVYGDRASGGSSAPTLAGGAYMYGGWIVVIFGMLILGVVAGLLYRFVALPGLLDNQVGLLAVYAGVIIANFHLGEGDFVGLWQGLVQRTVVFLIVATILCAGKLKIKI